MIPNFRFDQNKNFAENSEAFLEAISAQDPDMAAILRANWDELNEIVREGERDHAARRKLNTKIASALDALVTSSASKDGG